MTLMQPLAAAVPEHVTLAEKVGVTTTDPNVSLPRRGSMFSRRSAGSPWWNGHETAVAVSPR